nr:GEVED domain-containing protein [Fluviicola sp.]
MRLKLLLVVFCGVVSSWLHSQTTVSTNHTNNNGNGSVIFNVQNTNAFDIIITGVNCHLGTNAANSIQLLYNTTPYNDLAAPWGFGVVGPGQNGWISAGTATVNSNTANGVVNALSSLSLTIPAGATYQLGLSATTMQYMTLVSGGGANINTFSGGGVNLITGDGVSWGGTAYPSTPANYPRGFIGGITFIPAVPCTAPPTAGVVTAATNPICPSVNNTLSITGGTGGTGQTYQWQSSTDGVTYTDIVGATNSTYVANQAVATYYQFITTCSGQSDTSAALLVNMNSFTNCYCNSIPGSTIDEEIYNVTVNGGSTDALYANANGCTTAAPGPGSILSRYSNFKTLAPITSVAPGQTVSFTVVEDECDGATYYNNGMAIWIDFNQNGLFTDPGEQVYVEATTTISPRTVTNTFTVPMSAAVGNTVMRIIVAENFSGVGLQPCMTYTYGETEDHLITIQCPTLSGVTSLDEGVCSGNTVTLNGTTSNPLATISWWDAGVGGTQIGSGTTYTSGVLVANTDFYVQEDFSGCPSSVRDTVSVTVTAVDVTLTAVNASCNGGDNGSFTQTSVLCGTAPFEYSINGGAFGPIPTNLIAGTYSVVVRDVTLSSSVAYQVIITEPAAPSAGNATNVTYYNATLGWTTTGDETSWTIIYGPAGFDPATSGTVITGATNPYTLSGVLTEDTDYEFYVLSECGPAADTSAAFAFSTDPGFYTYDNQCGPAFVDISGTGTNLALTDDSEAGVTLPWPWSVNGTTVNTITV